MEITEEFIKDRLQREYLTDYQQVYDNSPMLQYLDKKMKAVHGDSKARRNLTSIYAIYSILYFYSIDYFEKKEEYCHFKGYDYKKLFIFCRTLYGGNKIQNHSLNNRINGEFHNRVKNTVNDLIVVNNGKYLIHIDYLYVGQHDISKVTCEIIEEYIELLKKKDNILIHILDELLQTEDYFLKRKRLKELLTEDAEARVFELISFAILKNHYKNTKVYFGYSRDTVEEVKLELYKTGRTNANDGGIDFVMRPIGRFFQVTEVNNYDKYLLDIDKVMHFPVSFVIKTKQSKEEVLNALEEYIAARSGGMAVLETRYRKAIEEIITINELSVWIGELEDVDIDGMIRDIDIYYRLEMNMDVDEEE